MIMNFISCSLTAFKASQYDKHWTIGCGHSGPDVHEGDIITEERSKELFDQDIIPYEDAVNALQSDLPFTMNQDQFNALVSFSFDRGTSSLDNFKGKDESFIANEILKYCHDNKGDVIPELKRHREEECDLFLPGMREARKRNEARIDSIPEQNYEYMNANFQKNNNIDLWEKHKYRIIDGGLTIAEDIAFYGLREFGRVGVEASVKYLANYLGVPEAITNGATKMIGKDST